MSESHEYADLFPLLAEGDDFDALAEDIRVNGLIDPITRHRDGRTLDGRRRDLACRKLGIEPASTVFEGSDAEALAFVISKNLHRRHLDTSQRAMIAAKLATMGRGGDRRSEVFKASIEALNDAQAAKAMGISEASVERAKAVRRDAEPEVVRAVEEGRISVSNALNIAREDPARQRRIAAGEEPPVRPAPPPTQRVSPALPAELALIRNALLSAPPPPEQAVAMVPDDRRGEFIRLALSRLLWIEAFLRLLETDQGDRPLGGGLRIVE